MAQVTKTKIELIIDVSANRYTRKVEMSIYSGFFSIDNYNKAVVSLNKKQTTDLINALKSQRKRKCVS